MPWSAQAYSLIIIMHTVYTCNKNVYNLFYDGEQLQMLKGIRHKLASIINNLVLALKPGDDGQIGPYRDV